MPQSLALLHTHLVFSTKNRSPLLNDEIRPALHSYLGKVLINLKCHPVIINSVDDHIHLLFDLARTVSMSQVVEDLKKSSSKWLKTQHPNLDQFAWQSGYGAFAVSASQIEKVTQYISNQKEHHLKTSFQDEYRLLLERHNIPYDEKYVWD
ncbi:IS200/IS605 family transposase [Roseibacillus persicicus]|uniref:IS200/IS605 family transposase n=1 Tax=Roseibacillus persicicus TaxID=454148 RepID=UPI002810814E|nr:IS200/IS605 family transposase [Roseibacillus persicicus]MDQ8189889.1 IS200/IS605 family transposase [Roseibacillus persicicus]